MNLAGFLQLVSDHESHEATHRVTGDDVRTVEMDSANDNVVDGTEEHSIDGLRFIRRVDTETHEGSGHTGAVVNNEHAMMGAVLFGKEFDQEVVVSVPRP